MHLLTNVSQMTHIKNVPSVAKANQLMHSVGLGCMNLHGHLVTEGILYGSKDSIDFMDHFMEAMNYYSLKSSMEMAKEKPQPSTDLRTVIMHQVAILTNISIKLKKNYRLLC